MFTFHNGSVKHQFINLDGRHLTGVLFKCSSVLGFKTVAYICLSVLMT